jgi:arsenical pump membrane protein
VPLLRHVAWSILPLVAGLFVLVQAVENTGALAPVVDWLSRHGAVAPRETAAIMGGSVAFASNVINNLPMGLLAATVTRSAHASAQLMGALLIGVDLGPNLSVTGSLATILWLIAIRREGEDVGFLGFLRIGMWVMPASLAAALFTFLAMRLGGG